MMEKLKMVGLALNVSSASSCIVSVRNTGELERVALLTKNKSLLKLSATGIVGKFLSGANPAISRMSPRFRQVMAALT